MTGLPFRRRSRPRGPARLAPVGDIPDTSEADTDILESVRPADYDGTTVIFTGASGAGLADRDVYRYEPYPEPAPRTEPPARLRAQPRYQPPQQPPPAGYNATTGPMPALGRPAVSIGDALTHDDQWGPMLAPLPCGHCGTPPPVPDGILERTRIIGHVNWLARQAGWKYDVDLILTCPPCQQDEAWRARQGQVAARPPRDTPPPPGCQWHLGYRGVPCTCPPTHCDRHDGIPAPGISLDEYQCTCSGSVLATDVMLTSHDYLRTGRAISLQYIEDAKAGPR